MDLVVKEQFVLQERRISLSELHTADEVFPFLLISSDIEGMFQVFHLGQKS